jgi:hypothetical protein
VIVECPAPLNGESWCAEDSGCFNGQALKGGSGCQSAIQNQGPIGAFSPSSERAVAIDLSPFTLVLRPVNARAVWPTGERRWPVPGRRSVAGVFQRARV